MQDIKSLDGLTLRATSWGFLNFLKFQAQIEREKYSASKAQDEFGEAATHAKTTLSHLGITLMTAEGFLTPIVFQNSCHPVTVLNQTLDIVVRQAMADGNEARAQKAAELFGKHYEARESGNLAAEIKKSAGVIKSLIKFHALVPGTLDFEEGQTLSPATELACAIFDYDNFPPHVFDVARAITSLEQKMKKIQSGKTIL